MVAMTSRAKVRISRYELPNFKVNVDLDRKFYLPGQNATVTVRADYLFGQPVTRGKVRVVRESERHWNYREQKWEVDEDAEEKGETNSDGSFVAKLDLSSDHESSQNMTTAASRTSRSLLTSPIPQPTEQNSAVLMRVTKIRSTSMFWKLSTGATAANCH